MKAAGLSHIGRVRANNEDAFYISPEKTLLAVADGMGGHKAGEIASSLAIEAIATLGDFQRNEAAPFLPAERFREAFSQANQRIWERAHASEDCKGMGTTLTAVWIHDSMALVAHIGDSRAYWIHQGRIRQITRDHTLVEELIKNGSIDRESALSHPQKNVLMKAVGADEMISPDLHELEVQEGDLLLLCSDGLTHYLSDIEIGELLAKGQSLETSLAQMTELALERGGADNITAAAVLIEANGGDRSWTEY